jgi:hypothetical protein
MPLKSPGWSAQLRDRNLLKVKRILAGTGLTGLTCALWVTLFSPGAHSQSAPEVSLTQSTWFWQGEVAAGAGVGVPGSPPPTVPDATVPSGDLAVSGPEQQGNAPKETYLEFDVSAIPKGSTISSFKVSLPVDPSAQNLVPAGTVPPIVACTPEVSWSGDPGPQPPNQKPTDHCDSAAPKVISNDSGKTYSVDIASIATGWVADGGQNFGVAITDDPSNTSTAYQVVFGPGSAINKLQATVDYTPPSSDNGLGGTSGVPVAGTEAPPATVSGTAIPSVPATPFAVPATGTPPVTAATPLPVATTAPGTGKRIRISPAGYPAATSTPPIGFWVAGLLLALLVALCMLELRRTPEVNLATTQRGVGRLLSRLATQDDGLSGERGDSETRRS